jgi:hypothetical protein
MTAHIIRVPSTEFAHATSALKAQRRWAVTGTPIQNRLSDLYSLFKYLQIHPFHDPNVFLRHIRQSWMSRSDPNAVAKLKILVSSVTLRRTKAIVHLPERRNETRILSFNDEERELYDQVKSRTLGLMDEGKVPLRQTYLSALQCITALRIICNHGVIQKTESLLGQTDSETLSPRSLDGYVLPSESLDCRNILMNNGLLSPSSMNLNPSRFGSQTPSNDTQTRVDSPFLMLDETPPDGLLDDVPWTSSAAQMTYDRLEAAGFAYCSSCSENLLVVSKGLVDQPLFNEEPRISKDSDLLCSICFNELQPTWADYVTICNHHPRCNDSSRTGGYQPPDLGSFLSSSDAPDLRKSSTKISTLLHDLELRPKGEKRCSN